MAELKIEEGFPMQGQRIHRYDSPGQFLIIAVIRGKRLIIPSGDDVIQPEDRVFIMARTKDMRQVEKFFLAKRRSVIEYVVILGGGLIGYYLAQELEKNYIVIYRNKNCKKFAERHDRTLGIRGDGTDIDLTTKKTCGADACRLQMTIN